jgi:hypothetical protein
MKFQMRKIIIYLRLPPSVCVLEFVSSPAEDILNSKNDQKVHFLFLIAFDTQKTSQRVHFFFYSFLFECNYGITCDSFLVLFFLLSMIIVNTYYVVYLGIKRP